ncbi:MAG: hypothetical protein JSU70_18315 [Phycisphaerales bacterium]|nr:MAG: hypothetical protein JSU70_18315 [Phycisphaerales bacterium]
MESKIRSQVLICTGVVTTAVLLLIPICVPAFGWWRTHGSLDGSLAEPEERGFYLLYLVFTYGIHLPLVASVWLFVHTARRCALRTAIFMYLVTLSGMALSAYYFRSSLGYPLVRYIPAFSYVFVVLPLLSYSLVTSVRTSRNK